MKCPVCDSVSGLRVAATVQRENNFDLRVITCLECGFQGQTETKIVYAKKDGEFIHIKKFVEHFAEEEYQRWAGKRIQGGFAKQSKLFNQE